LPQFGHRGWSDEDLAKLSGGNLLRVVERVEQVAASMRTAPTMNTIQAPDGLNPEPGLPSPGGR
jgi:hypothetical protein